MASTFCTEGNQTLTFFVNGEEFHSDISQYVFDHNDKIMISLGEYKINLKAYGICGITTNPRYSKKDYTKYR